MSVPPTDDALASSSAEDEAPILDAIARWLDRDVRHRVLELEHGDVYPHALVAGMRRLGLFGALVPAEYGGLSLDVTTYARVVEELCRGFMSLAGVINSHTMAALIVLHHGTEEQRRRLLPRFARGEARGGLCLTEPHAGSDVQAIRTVARRVGDHYVITGTKMFVTNGREGNTFALLAVTDRQHSFVISGTGDIIEPDDGILAIGSGGPFALAAARALVANTALPPADIVRKALEIAGEICVYTNTHVTVLEPTA